MKSNLLKIFILFCIISCQTNRIVGDNYSGHFEGDEPFWNLEIVNNNYVLNSYNKSVNGTLVFSKMSSRGNSIAFSDGKVFGIINQTYNKCELAITEEDSLYFEVYFSFEKETFKGCGKFSNKVHL